MTKKKNQIITFVTGCAALFQLYFVACLTIWKNVVVIPNQIFCPPITKEYWFWYIDEYVSPVNYKTQLIGVHGVLQILCGFLFFLGIYLLLNQACSIKGKLFRTELSLVIAAAVVYAAIFLYNRMYGQPYRLFMDAGFTEVLALLLLALYFVSSRSKESGT